MVCDGHERPENRLESFVQAWSTYSAQIESPEHLATSGPYLLAFDIFLLTAIYRTRLSAASVAFGLARIRKRNVGG